MNHAFIITAYKNGEQLERLIDQLDSEHSFFYINIDKKSELCNDVFLNKMKSRKNVFLPSEFINVYWGGFSHLNAFVMMLSVAIKNKSIDYFHTISGQCFPTTTMEEFDSFFVENNGKEYITYFELPSNRWLDGGLGRVEYYHLNDLFDPKKRFFKYLNPFFISLQKKLKIKRKQPTCIVNYYGGGTWWSLSKNAINYIFEMMDADTKLLKRFKHTHCSEEIFFQSILLNSKFKNDVVSDDLRYIDWNTRNGNCPANLDETDFDKIVNSNVFFARKLELPLANTLRIQLIEHITASQNR